MRGLKKPVGNPFKAAAQEKSKAKNTFNFGQKIEEGKEAEYFEQVKIEQNRFLQLSNLTSTGIENRDPNQTCINANLSPVTPGSQIN